MFQELLNFISENNKMLSAGTAFGVLAYTKVLGLPVFGGKDNKNESAVVRHSCYIGMASAAIYALASVKESSHKIIDLAIATVGIALGGYASHLADDICGRFK